MSIKSFFFMLIVIKFNQFYKKELFKMRYNIDQPNEQNIENGIGDNPNKNVSQGNGELLEQALIEAIENKIKRAEAEISDIEIPPPSRRHKIRMNRLFRERVGGEFLPFPEEDNLYERLRSKVVVKLKLNKALDRRKQCRQRK